MTQLFANNAYGSLGATLTDSATSLTLATGQGARFPTPTGGDYFLLTLVGLDTNTNENAWEIVKVTGRSTDALTIVRAQEGTTAATWVSGTHVELRATAGTFDSFTDTAQAAAAAPVQSVFGRTGAVTLGSSDVTTALGFTPENAANKGAANGYAPLGSDSKIASTYLPSYVDDVLEYANYAALPSIGETGKIYVLATPYTAAGVTSSQFRWSGSAYAAIIASPGSTDAVTEGSTNLYFTNARAQAALAGMYLPSTGGTLTGDLTFSGTNRRIIGDFTNTTRVLVQTSSANSNTVFGLIPNGTAVNSQFHVWGAADITNAPLGAFTINSSSVQIQSSAAGTGTVLPFRVLVGTTEVFRATTGYNFLIGSSVDDGVNKFQLTGSAALTGNLNFTGTGNRITGDFSNATAASRAAFQSSTANGNTLVNLLPNGTATVSRWGAFNGADSANASIVSLGITATAAEIVSTFNGTGTALPLDVYVGGAKQLSIATTGAGIATKDWTFQGVTVGRGAGAVLTNTAIGASSLAANTTGIYNTADGYQALQGNTSGNLNTAVGGLVLKTNTTGNYNTALGYTGLASNTTGSSNVAVGAGDGATYNGALGLNTTGSYNVAVGNGALQANTTANDNTAVGYGAGFTNTTGTRLTAIGKNALYGNTTGSYSVAIGFAALYANTTGSNVAIGDNTLNSNTTGSNNVAIGTFDGSILPALYANTTGFGNVAIGAGALKSNTTGSNVTAVGFQAGYQATTANGNSTYIGYSAGASVTSGYSNTFVGARSGSTGYGAGQFITTGSNNTILGAYNGNQGGLDIRTANNFIVLSDGDGNPRAYMSSSFDGAMQTPGAGYRSTRNLTVSALNTAYLMYNFAMNGILVVRDNTSGGTDLWLCDPNQGFSKVAGNIPVATTVYYSGGGTYIQQTSGAVTRNFSYCHMGA